MKFVMLNWRDPENPDAGGAELVTLGYLSDLVGAGHEVFWLTHTFRDCHKSSEIHGVKIFRLGGLVKSRIMAIHWVRQNGPFDLIIDQHHGIPWFTPFWAPNNSISYIHEVLGPIWKSFYPFPLAELGAIQEKWTLWFYRNHPFWTGCMSTSNHLKMIGVKNISAIPYGVDLPFPSDLDKKTLSQPLKLIMVSRIAPNKRIDHGVYLLKELLDAGFDVTLNIVGKGESEEQLRKLANKLKLENKIKFSGFVSAEEKFELLAQAHFLIHTSKREGWGLNVIEANSVGTPAVVYPVPGLIDSTSHLKTGIVAQEETPRSLAQSIMAFLSDSNDYQNMRVQAFQHSQKHLWKNVLPISRNFLIQSAQN